LHEVAIDEGHPIKKAFNGGISDCPLILVVIVVEADYIDTAKLGDLASRSPNTASYIKDPLSFSEAHLVSKVVFVPSNSVAKWLAVNDATEMEGRSPNVLEDVGDKIIISE
jgi:hypothetical protein